MNNEIMDFVIRSAVYDVDCPRPNEIDTVFTKGIQEGLNPGEIRAYLINRYADKVETIDRIHKRYATISA